MNVVCKKAASLSCCANGAVLPSVSIDYSWHLIGLKTCYNRANSQEASLVLVSGAAIRTKCSLWTFRCLVTQKLCSQSSFARLNMCWCHFSTKGGHQFTSCLHNLYYRLNHNGQEWSVCFRIKNQRLLGVMRPNWSFWPSDTKHQHKHSLFLTGGCWTKLLEDDLILSAGQQGEPFGEDLSPVENLWKGLQTPDSFTLRKVHIYPVTLYHFIYSTLFCRNLFSLWH